MAYTSMKDYTMSLMMPHHSMGKTFGYCASKRLNKNSCHFCHKIASTRYEDVYIF